MQGMQMTWATLYQKIDTGYKLNQSNLVDCEHHKIDMSHRGNT
jgi:hypothetical protein